MLGERKLSACSRITTFEKLLLTCTAVIVAAIIIIVATYSGSKTETVPINCEELCLSKACIKSAYLMMSKMDQSVNPCDDFYKFACGKWIKDYVFQDGYVYGSMFEMLEGTLERDIKQILEEPIIENNTNVLDKARLFYKACMDADAIDERQLDDITDIINGIGGWPILLGDDWNEEGFSWTNSTKYFYNKGLYSSMISLEIAPNLDYPSYYVIQVDQLNFREEVQREILLKGINDTKVQAYYKYMIDVVRAFGAKDGKQELLEVLEFEIALANITLAKEDRRDYTKLNNKLSIEVLEDKYPYVPWLEFGKLLAPENTTINETEVLVVAVPQFLTDLEELLKITSNRTVANYIIWRAVAEAIPNLSKNMRNILHNFKHFLGGTKEERPRWKDCIKSTRNTLPHLVGALYVRKYFDEDKKKIATNITNYVLEAFIENMKTVAWMDDDTKMKALEKVNHTKQLIGYPDELKDDAKLTELFENIKVHQEKYFLSVLNINRFNQGYRSRLLHQKYNKSDWFTHSNVATANAYYDFAENGIVLGSGILQEPFFDKERPNYINFGAIGFIIGHEITHGFDITGKDFDGDGNLNSWWDSDTNKTFHKRAKCFVDQYGNYTINGTKSKINGLRTQNENIADNGGLKHGYLAYKKWLELNHPEQKLPGLDYTPFQMYFISAAQNFCAKYTPLALNLILDLDIYPPYQYRVVGAIQNSKFFAQDFGCPVNSKMNPKKECKVW